MRGKHETHAAFFAGARITPACAGKTVFYSSLPSENRDHPRVCGENFPGVPSVKTTVGSPPRVRGKRCILKPCVTNKGITPACAGKTDNHFIVHVHHEDHPRVCGENLSGYWKSRKIKGSPPRVRGKQSGLFLFLHRVRITPACAGKTLRKWRISVVDPSPQPRSSLTSRRADASIGSQRAPCAAPV